MPLMVQAPSERLTARLQTGVSPGLVRSGPVRGYHLQNWEEENVSRRDYKQGKPRFGS